MLIKRSLSVGLESESFHVSNGTKRAKCLRVIVCTKFGDRSFIFDLSCERGGQAD